MTTKRDIRDDYLNRPRLLQIFDLYWVKGYDQNRVAELLYYHVNTVQRHMRNSGMPTIHEFIGEFPFYYEILVPERLHGMVRRYFATRKPKEKERGHFELRVESNRKALNSLRRYLETEYRIFLNLRKSVRSSLPITGYWYWRLCNELDLFTFEGFPLQPKDITSRYPGDLITRFSYYLDILPVEEIDDIFESYFEDRPFPCRVRSIYRDNLETLKDYLRGKGVSVVSRRPKNSQSELIIEPETGIFTLQPPIKDNVHTVTNVFAGYVEEACGDVGISVVDLYKFTREGNPIPPEFYGALKRRRVNNPEARYQEIFWAAEVLLCIREPYDWDATLIDKDTDMHQLLFVT